MGMGPRGVKRPADLYEAVAVVDLEAMQIFFMKIMGRKITMDVKADCSETIDNIKEKIESKEEILVTKQTFVVLRGGYSTTPRTCHSAASRRMQS